MDRLGHAFFIRGGIVMTKKVVSILMTLIIIATMVSVTGITVSAYSIPDEAGFAAKLSSLRNQFPNGGYYSGTYYENGTAKAWECHGYALELVVLVDIGILDIARCRNETVLGVRYPVLHYIGLIGLVIQLHIPDYGLYQVLAVLLVINGKVGSISHKSRLRT